MKIKKISINGKIMEPRDAKISAIDEVLWRGVAVFETFRISDGRVFLLDERFARLNKSLKALAIDWPVSLVKFRKWIREISEFLDNKQDGLVRLVVTSGSDQPTTIIYLYSIDKSKPYQRRGIILKDYKRILPDYYSKTGFRIKTPEYIAAKLYAQEAKNTDIEPILLSPKNHVAEGFTATVFWVVNSQIYTPPLELGILPGITRSYIIQKFSAKEKLINQRQFEAADEIWLASSVSGLRALSSINNIKKPGTSGDMYRKIYHQLASDIDQLSQPLTS